MRRLLLLAGGLAAIASLTTAGLASSAGVASAASPANVPHKFTPGSVWTQTNLSNHGCEVETIGADDTFTANANGDAGTYTQSVKTGLTTETWTAGKDKGQTLRAHWSANNKEFKGKGQGGVGGGKWKTTIVPGATPKC